MTLVPQLPPRTKLGLEIAAAGVAGGIVGDALLRAMPWGLNVALGSTALIGAGIWLVRRHQVKYGPDAPWLAITALLLGLAFLRRDEIGRASCRERVYISGLPAPIEKKKRKSCDLC